MKTGRNDSCPCGSGKKYKQCCLQKELRDPLRSLPQQQGSKLLPEEPPDFDTSDLPEEDFRSQSLEREEEPAGSGSADSEVELESDPRREAADARWGEFEAADYQRRIDLFIQALDEPDLADDLICEMLDAIDREARKRGDWDQLEILVRALQERLPDVYDRRAPFLLHSLIINAVVRGRLDGIAPWAREMAEHADDIDMFNLVLDPLAYHGQLPTLVEMMRIGWPLVRESDNIISLGIDEFVDRAVRFEILFYCEQAESPCPEDPELIRRLQFYVQPIKREPVSGFVKHLTSGIERAFGPGGTGGRPFEQAWFDEDEAVESGDPRAKWCELLCVEFLGYLHRREGVPYSKGDLATESLAQYLIRRLRGETEVSPKLYDPGQRPRRQMGKRRYRQQRSCHVLCPDPTTLDAHLADMFRFLSARHHRAAATWEVIPAWLRFLESQQLIDQAEHSRTLNSMATLSVNMLHLWENAGGDPALYEGSQRTWQRSRIQSVEEPEATY